MELLEGFRLNDVAVIENALSSMPDASLTYGSPLHLALSLSNKATIAWFIQKYQAKINESWLNKQSKAQNNDSPLHLVAKLNRLEFVDSLFSFANINDTLRDNNGRLAYEVAKNEKIADAIRGWIDINAPVDMVTEMSILHFAAKHEDQILVRWCLERGADPNVKDLKGKKPSELLPKKEHTIREILKSAIHQAPIQSDSLTQATSSSQPLSSSSLHPPPKMTGNIQKWTNYAVGYKNRFFVLENGLFSYFKDENDYPLSCRGSFSTLIVDVSLPEANDMSRFDIIGKGGMRYSLKARSPADAKKWVWALNESKTWMVDMRKKEGGNLSPEEEWDGTHAIAFRSSHDDQHRLYNISLNSVAPNGLDDVTGRDVMFSPNNELREGEMPATSTDDIPTLMYLLETQLDVQERVIEEILDMKRTDDSMHGSKASLAVPEMAKTSSGAAGSNVDNIDAVSALLKSSRRQILNNVRKIVEICESREVSLEKRFKTERESKSRWEEIVRSVLEGGNSMIPKKSLKKIDTAVILDIKEGGEEEKVQSPIINNDNDEYRDSDDDDVFYDALGGRRTSGEEKRGEERRSSQFLEHVFGFETLKEGDLKVHKTLLRGSGVSSSSGDDSKSKGWISLEDLEVSLKGYTVGKDQRERLPLQKGQSKPALNVWSFLKSAIGKDLSKVTLPVFFNEPLSMLQRMCEDVEYIDLLSVASQIGNLDGPESIAANTLCTLRGWDIKQLRGMGVEESSMTRLLFVSAFAMSNYSSTVGRTSKPFNPMLGETYEMVSKDKQYRYISEQVCHHPPISACHCESPDYSFDTEVNVKSKFWGKSLEIHPLGTCHVRLPYKDTFEHYSWRKVTTSVNNLIVGTLTIEHYGDMIIKNWRTGEECILTFKPRASGGWFGWGGGSSAAPNDTKTTEDNSGGGGVVVGKLKDSKGIEVFDLTGKWDSDLIATKAATLDRPLESKFFSKPILLWKRTIVDQKEALLNFNFTKLAILMNEITPEMTKYLPPTDSRLRPDQKALEEGRWNDADLSKQALEVAQRLQRKEIVKRFEETGVADGPDAKGGPAISVGEVWWTPRWFVRDVDADTQEEYWRFVNDYWIVRRKVVEEGGGWPVYIRNLFEVKKLF